MIRKYCIVVGILLMLVTVFGVFLPTLFSAKSDELVMIGLIVSLLMPPAIGGLIMMLFNPKTRRRTRGCSKK